jgi:N6-adenosine-specific RNA methylase IME4
LTYAAIMVDPPWAETGGGGRGANDHYDVMRTPAILETMLRAPCWRPAADAHLYLWATMQSLLEGLWLLDALGFRYVSHVVWVKLCPDDLFGALDVTMDIGIGQYFRGAHETLLFGVRGKGYAVRSERRDLPSVIVARTPRYTAIDERRVAGGRIHSRKPDAAYELVERRTVGARLEMFSRVARPGWDLWGREAPEPQQQEKTA